MFLSKIKSRYRFVRKKYICQGDIFRDIRLLLDIKINTRKKNPEVKQEIITIPYAVVMTQDCDLLSDFRNKQDQEAKNQDKHLHTILICPAYQEDQFFQGDHIWGLKMRQFNSGEIKKLKNNEEFKRYHYLKKDENLAIPNLVIDFKNFFTIPTNKLYKQKSNYVATINELFREELSQRFASFLSRIGLPVLVEDE